MTSLHFSLTDEQLNTLPVFGIAGNFAEHLQQAGEDADFTDIQTETPNAPKGIFPIYIPHHQGQLGIFPLCHDKILADFQHPIHLQAEPELCLLLEIGYDEHHAIQTLTPKAFSAFNDCSIRKPNAKKISEKKNWGPCSKGISQQWLACAEFNPGSTLAHYHIASFLYRDQTCIAYGIDSPVEGYSYFYQQLIQWMIQTFHTQTDHGPLENLQDLLQTAGHPKQIIIALGATRYTPFGETHYLQPNDELLVLVYPQSESTLHQTLQKTAGRIDLSNLPENSLVLKQTITAL